MAEDSRPTKRRRSSLGPSPLVIIAPGEPHNPTTGEEILTRHTDFWLEDGNLILLAGKTAFRVLRSLLVKKSAVFADMFATGCADATESFDDCPVIRLSDHPEDLRDFLQCLMSCSPLRIQCGVPMSDFSELHAAIHLAHKYQCPDVGTHALSILKRYYAPTFYTHDKYISTTSSLFAPQGTAAIAAVNIARLTNTPSMLPFAFYLISSTVPGQMVDGYERRDGSIEHLSTQDLKACIGACSELAWILAGLVGRVFTLTQTAGCKRARRCTAARRKILAEAQDNAQGRCDALESFRASIEDWTDELRLCKLCRKEMLARDVEERRRVWEKLPGLFGLTVDDLGYAFANWDEEQSGSDINSDSDSM